MKHPLLSVIATGILLVPAAVSAGPQVETVARFAVKVTARVPLLAAITGMTAFVSGTSPSDAVSLPTQCLSEKNQGACVDCCKTATDCSANGTASFSCNACSHFCKAVVPPPPGGSEPLP